MGNKECCHFEQGYSDERKAAPCTATGSTMNVSSLFKTWLLGCESWLLVFLQKVSVLEVECVIVCAGACCIFDVFAWMDCVIIRASSVSNNGTGCIKVAC